MNSMTVPSRLQDVYERLGPVHFLQFEDLDLVSAHYHLGEDVRSQVQMILTRRLDLLNTVVFAEQLRHLRACGEAIRLKGLAKDIPELVRAAVRSYQRCLAAWAEGAGLHQFTHPLFEQVESVSAYDLALLLQDENSGCQTGLYREEDGKVLLWHTEEDVDRGHSRFDYLRVAVFGAPPTQIFSFIYPDLLPGPAFNWRSDGYIQAVDALTLRPGTLPAGFLANAAAWVTLQLGGVLSSAEVLQALAPFADGYALVSAVVSGDSITAGKVEFAGEEVLETMLGLAPANYLYQANIVSQKESVLSRRYEDLEQRYYREYLHRETRTKRLLAHVQNHGQICQSFLNLVETTEGGPFAYANPDVKAYIVAHLGPDDQEVWLGSGPRLPGSPVYHCGIGGIFLEGGQFGPR